jgi:hypothetical protein
MQTYQAYCGVRTARLLLAAMAAFLVSMPAATNSVAEEPGKLCSETLTKDYGVAKVDDVSAHQREGHRSVYADARLANGETVRFRCLFRKGGVNRVQVYSPAVPLSANPWARWTPVEAQRATP